KGLAIRRKGEGGTSEDLTVQHELQHTKHAVVGDEGVDFLAAVYASPADRVVPLLWPGLRTRPRDRTEGLPAFQRRKEETWGRSRWTGRETVPQREEFLLADAVSVYWRDPAFPAS